MRDKTSVYFPGLNALRFIAATAVIFHHIEQYKFWAGIPNLWGNATIDALGHKAVSLFFVLSGFLITYLLLVEHEKSGTINVRNFYVRRILRIWPLYYFIVFLCLAVVPFVIDLDQFGVDQYEDFWIKLVLLLLVLPNFVRVIAPNFVGGNQLWSIGVEEQFYLVWPWFVKAFIRSLPTFLVSFIALKIVITILFDFVIIPAVNTNWIQSVYRLWLLLQVEQMAIGAIGAWILYTNSIKWLNFLYRKEVWITCLIAIALLFSFPFHHWLISYVEAAIFVSLILNLATNKKFPVKMEGPWVSKLGNISYGIYMYHTLVVAICLSVLRALGLHQGNLILFNMMFYSISVLGTIGVAQLSYVYFESYFLKLKTKFMIIKSGTSI